MTAAEIAILRIELTDIEPLIWRRVAVRASSTLSHLHRVIQAAMGWLDYHLWEFRVGEDVYTMPHPEFDSWRTVRPANTTKLSKVLNLGIDEFAYIYDMGDDWHHRIIIEKIDTAIPDQTYPALIEGERRCPPEDCGGVPGYYQFIDDISGSDKGPGCRKKKDALKWYGRPYDPDDIDEHQLQIALRRLATDRRSAPAAKSKP
jgi:hypothetical protein